jgi:hypothetical protein
MEALIPMCNIDVSAFSADRNVDRCDMNALLSDRHLLELCSQAHQLCERMDTYKLV